MLKKIIIFLMLLFICEASSADECSFEDFFKQEYSEVLNYVPLENQKDALSIIYNAYSIKLKGLQTQYELEKEKYECLLSNENATVEEIDFEKNKLNEISDMAMEEYFAFIEDVNFEVSDCDKKVKKQLDKCAKKSKKDFKKMVKTNCKTLSQNN